MRILGGSIQVPIKGLMHTVVGIRQWSNILSRVSIYKTFKIIILTINCKESCQKNLLQVTETNNSKLRQRHMSRANSAQGSLNGYDKHLVKTVVIVNQILTALSVSPLKVNN